MNPDRWQQIDRLLDEALDRKPEERPTFLEQACAADPELRKEVEALLEAHNRAGSFVQKPALGAAAAPPSHPPSASLSGKRLGPYDVLCLIGRGGMGEVYQARDTRLGRSVALKILPSEFVTDEERMRRFRREAKAASALSHANVATIYDVGESEGTHYIAMEYVEGKTLNQLIGRKGMRLSDALNYGMQIADALAASHEAGIVHRDLKPGNVMVTSKGQVKVLDFGLAKWKEKVSFSGEDSEATGQPTTEEGRIVGTVAYMSPEQAEGKAVDARSDIFSFGSVLYEMVTGRRAFEGETQAWVLAAILKEDPRPSSEVSAKIPKEVERLISRCLKKDPERRFQHMNDLRVELQELKEDSESLRLQAGPDASKRTKPARLVIGAVAAVVVIALAVAGGYWLSQQHSAEPEALLTAMPLTSYPGYESYPSFSPDGTQVAFQWCTEEPAANCDIYVKQIGMEPPSRMTSDPALDFYPAWSPDGQFIAFLRQLSPTRMALMLIPQRGGQERVLGEGDITDLVLVRAWQRSHLAWTPDSRWLVLFWGEAGKPAKGLYMLSVETREARRLTTSEFDGTPAVSPDGQTLAFNRSIGRDLIYLLRLAKDYQPEGEPAHVAPAGESLENYGLAWSPDGKDIVFSSGVSAKGGLWRVEASAGATPRKLAFASEGASAPAVSRQGNRLAYVVFRSDANIWRIDLQSPGQNPGVPVQLIASTRQEQSPTYSPDGKRIAFTSDRSGAREIWVCASDGSNPVQLTAFGGPGVYSCTWSPDGQNIAFAASPAGNQDLYVVSANGGPVRRVTTYPGGDASPYWSRDGQSLYFRSFRPNLSDIWKIPAIGGEAVQITRNGGDVPQESPDGRFVYYEKGWPLHCSVWRMPAAGGEEVEVLDSTHSEAGWTVAKQGIYFFTPPDGQGRSDVCLYRFSTGKTSKILTIERNVTNRIAVSPDERTILYGQYDQVGSDLMLVENFR